MGTSILFSAKILTHRERERERGCIGNVKDIKSQTHTHILSGVNKLVQRMQADR